MLLSTLLLGTLLAQTQPAPVKSVLVYKNPGRYAGWPANHGIWSWGNEILVGFSAAWFQNKSADRHQANSDKPEEPRLARSLDGGETWTIEAPPSLLPPEQGGKQPELAPVPTATLPASTANSSTTTASSSTLVQTGQRVTVRSPRKARADSEGREKMGRSAVAQ